MTKETMSDKPGEARVTSLSPGGRGRKRTLVAGLLLCAGLFTPAQAADIPTPTGHLGFRPGADFHLAEWKTVVSYFQKLDAASPRITVRELGTSTEGRPFLVATVSSEETINNLPRYQNLQHRLADPRITQTDDDPITASKPVVLITCSIHSTETASTLMSMELAYELASSDSSAAKEILDNTILLLVPSVNPDGVDKVAAWYERTKGHPWEGSGMVELYHKYAGHDTNRDWFMLNLKETQLLTHLLYYEWYPTLTYDVHQMGSKGARLFVPPFYDPINPNLEPTIHESIALIGSHMAADLAKEGKKGVLTHALYDNWWNGGNRTTPQRHNMVGVLTEAASVRMASPIFLEYDDLRGGSRGFPNHAPAINFVDPWPGGWWRLRDIVDYELIAARSLLTLAARYKTQFQRDYERMAKTEIALGKNEPPYAWIVPQDQTDPGNAADMVRILHDTGVEVERAKSDFEAAGTKFTSGAWVLRSSQPYRAHLKDMMERQDYPPRVGPGGKPEPPYDVAGWTLPLQMRVRAVEVDEPLEVNGEKVERLELPRGQVKGPADGPIFVVENRSNDDFKVLNALLEAGVDVHRLPREVSADKKTVAGGSLVFDGSPAAKRVLEATVPKLSIIVRAESDPNLLKAIEEGLSSASQKVERVQLGLYQPWMPSMDEGWTRLVLEKYGFKYTTLHNADIRAGDLRKKFRTILIPAIETKTIREGYAPARTEPAYVGGLGTKGADALREFVKDGGTLVCLADSCNYAIEALGLPVKNVLKGVPDSAFYCPGSILRVTCGREPSGGFDPLLAGMPSECSVFFDRSLAFAWDAAPAFALVRYAKTDVLQSGWLLGADKIEGKAALARVDQGKGQVILFGFPPQHRGQTAGTFRLLFNAIVY